MSLADSIADYIRVFFSFVISKIICCYICKMNLMKIEEHIEPHMNGLNLDVFIQSYK